MFHVEKFGAWTRFSHGRHCTVRETHKTHAERAVKLNFMSFDRLDPRGFKCLCFLWIKVFGCMFYLLYLTASLSALPPNSASLFVDSMRSFSHDPQLFCIEGNATRFKTTSGCGHGRHLALFGQWKDTNSSLYLILRIITQRSQFESISLVQELKRRLWWTRQYKLQTLILHFRH